VAGEQLLDNIQLGDRQALEELCRREWRPIYGLVYSAVRDSGEAQDLTQEVFARALRSLPRYRDTGVPFHAYLATIARNLLRDRYRDSRPASVELTDALGLESGDAGPEERAISASESARVHTALATLPADYQRVLRLRVLDGRSTEEVAATLGRSPAATRQLQHRAVVALRSALGMEPPR
jgi:RNA polymerase sigma-70 factor (ECF subfamily)